MHNKKTGFIFNINLVFLLLWLFDKVIINIIYDNSVKIGDGNTIDKSIIGDDNNDYDRK